ncbi:MAG TPA: MBL fold metallo-hydrolase [Chloroflexota bacterium]|jgi:ribonuclease BN (tRNA processing enzyme)|nr:MBL fold metallo-hydrolase [Chloroflexota bacterium]
MAALTITILGASPAAPNPGGACSSYLLRQGESSVLVDCGPGSAGRIPLHVPVNGLSAVTISHLHPDHYLDLVQLYYMLRFGEPRPAELPRRVSLFVPPEGRDFFRRFGQFIAAKPAMLEDMFEICEYAAGPTFDIGGLAVTFHPVQHYIPSHALRARGQDGATFVFSSDVAPCPELVEAAREADLFLCESALFDPAQDEPDPTRRGHMSAGEAGSAATDAGVRRLLITHCRSGAGYDERHLSAARGAFSGPVDLAREGDTYTV